MEEIIYGNRRLFRKAWLTAGLLASCSTVSVNQERQGRGEQKGHDLVLPPDSIQLTLRLNVHSKNYSPQELCGENTESLVSFALFTEGG